MIAMQVCRLLRSLEMPAAFVARGQQAGIYGTWDKCKAQVHQYSGAILKKFPSREASENFVREKSSSAKEKVKTSKKKRKIKQDLDNVALSAEERPLPAIDRLVQEELPEKKCEITDTSEIPTSTSNKQAPSLEFITDNSGYVIVYTDGACSSNGCDNAQAGLGVWFGDDHPLNVSQPVFGRTTNNNAEIQAVTIAARKAKEVGVEKLKIITDSKFLIQCITIWMPKWKKNGWKTAAGRPVVNKVELLEMEEALNLLEIVWEHVNGHQGIYGNEMADKLAKEGCKHDVDCKV
ncbi:ribonuclease H1-like [Augochlora pura]